MAGSNKNYVVFRGRKVGIFKQWSECHTQVIRFKGSAFKGYDSREDAEAAWEYFCNEARVPVEVDEEQQTDRWTPGPSTNTNVSLEGLSLKDEVVGNDGVGKDGVPNDPDPNEFLIEYSNQALLRDVCEAIRVPEATLSLLESTNINGALHHRYVACVTVDSPVFMVGDFYVDHNEARDSASWVMLHHLVGKVGKPIKDYNYHVVEELVAQMSVKDDQIATMAAEIALLEHEISTLKAAIGFPH